MQQASALPFGLSVVFSRKDPTELSQAACGAHRQRMAAMRRAGEQRWFCLLSHGVSSALTALLYPIVKKLLTGHMLTSWKSSVIFPVGSLPIF
jgi:hypothetical protein